MSLEFLLPFLNTGVVFAFFKEDGKLDFSTESLKFARRMSANISALTLIISVGISVSWHALEVSNSKIFLKISYLFVLEKENDSLIACFSYSEYAGMVPIFYSTFQNRITDIVSKRFTAGIFFDIKVTDSVRKESIQNFRSFTVTLNNLFFIY